MRGGGAAGRGDVTARAYGVCHLSHHLEAEATFGAGAGAAARLDTAQYAFALSRTEVCLARAPMRSRLLRRLAVRARAPAASARQRDPSRQRICAPGGRATTETRQKAYGRDLYRLAARDREKGSGPERDEGGEAGRGADRGADRGANRHDYGKKIGGAGGQDDKGGQTGGEAGWKAGGAADRDRRDLRKPKRPDAHSGSETNGRRRQKVAGKRTRTKEGGFGTDTEVGLKAEGVHGIREAGGGRKRRTEAESHERWQRRTEVRTQRQTRKKSQRNSGLTNKNANLSANTGKR